MSNGNRLRIERLRKNHAHLMALADKSHAPGIPFHVAARSDDSTWDGFLSGTNGRCLPPKFDEVAIQCFSNQGKTALQALRRESDRGHQRELLSELLDYEPDFTGLFDDFYYPREISSGPRDKVAELENIFALANRLDAWSDEHFRHEASDVIWRAVKLNVRDYELEQEVCIPSNQISFEGKLWHSRFFADEFHSWTHDTNSSGRFGIRSSQLEIADLVFDSPEYEFQQRDASQLNSNDKLSMWVSALYREFAPSIRQIGPIEAVCLPWGFYQSSARYVERLIDLKPLKRSEVSRTLENASDDNKVPNIASIGAILPVHKIELTPAQQDIINVIRKAGKRITTSGVLNALTDLRGAASEGTTKVNLAALVRIGQLKNRQDTRPKGYGLPEWS